MSQNYKIGATITPTIDSERDLFGATGFKTSYINKSNGQITPVAGDFTEVMLTVDGLTTIANGIALAGANTFAIATGHGFEDGDVIEDANDNTYYILAVTGDVIEVKKPLVADIPDGDTITQVGNTGIYSISFSIPTEGDYNILIANPTINMQNEIVPVTITTEVLADAQVKLDDIKQKMGLARSEVKFRAYV